MFAFLHVNVIYALYIYMYACIYKLKLLAAFIIVIELRIKLKQMQLLYCIMKKQVVILQLLFCHKNDVWHSGATLNISVYSVVVAFQIAWFILHIIIIITGVCLFL